MRTLITPDEAEKYSDAISDVVCWLDGFKAAGGVYYPDSIDVLRELNMNLKEIMCTKGGK